MEYKIVIMGDIGVGKTHLLLQMLQNCYLSDLVDENEEPIPEESYRKLVTVDQETCLLDILDTVTTFNEEGTVEMTSMMLNMYTNKEESVGFLLTYSVSSRKSFNNIQKYKEWILHQRRNFLKNNRFPVVLVATKCDETAREVSKEEGENLARELLYDCPFIESSAKVRTNIEESFFTIVREIRKELIYKEQHQNNQHSKRCVFM